MNLLHVMAVGVLAVSPRVKAQTATYGQRIVAAVLMGEARGEGEVGMAAVAEVVRNRAVEHGKTPLEVVCKKGAFSCLNGKTPDRLYQQHCRSPLFKAALRIAKTVYMSPEKLPGTTRGATFYDRKGANPPWLSEVRLVAIIGQHAFYVAKRKGLDQS
jgi:spore germination cell wall hydrolase CwlJ-like protein